MVSGHFSKYIDVWGTTIIAQSGVSDTKVKHVANVLAQYLDNDEDGVPDNKAACKMKKNKALLFMPNNPDAMEKIDSADIIHKLSQKGYFYTQDLNGEETNPGCYAGKCTQDATLEEVLHLVTNAYVELWPLDFAPKAGSRMTNAMDKARGGRFKKIPKRYPRGAWYTYDDQTCTYNCMAIEYFYWVLTSILGAQGNRPEIRNEWKANTLSKLKKLDMPAYKLMTNKRFNLPKKLPNGSYQAEARMQDACKVQDGPVKPDEGTTPDEPAEEKDDEPAEEKDDETAEEKDDGQDEEKDDGQDEEKDDGQDEEKDNDRSPGSDEDRSPEKDNDRSPGSDEDRSPGSDEDRKDDDEDDRDDDSKDDDSKDEKDDDFDDDTDYYKEDDKDYAYVKNNWWEINGPE